MCLIQNAAMIISHLILKHVSIQAAHPYNISWNWQFDVASTGMIHPCLTSHPAFSLRFSISIQLKLFAFIVYVRFCRNDYDFISLSC